MEDHRYRLLETFPGIGNYQCLRGATGLSPKSLEAAQRGLPNTLFGVSVLCGDTVVGMGRVIGDSGCFFQVVDVAVLPEHQGRGLGKMIMSRLVEWLKSNAPKTAIVSLLADGAASRLYEQFGFRDSSPGSKGMILRL